MKLDLPVDLAGLAKLILSPECRSIALLTGAGVSVASGIPDFRSPGGMYDTLRPELLTATPYQKQMMEQDPTHVVTWDLFQTNAFPYLQVRRPFILGTQKEQWKATIAHRFAELLHVKTDKLTRVYTQNIDDWIDSAMRFLPIKLYMFMGPLLRQPVKVVDTTWILIAFVSWFKPTFKIFIKPRIAKKHPKHHLRLLSLAKNVASIWLSQRQSSLADRYLQNSLGEYKRICRPVIY
jgi:hypothetical protein